MYWSTDLPWIFMVREIAHFGQNGATVCTLIHRQLSVRKSLLFTPILTIRIIRALPLRRNYRISIAKMQTCLQALRLFSAYNTIGTVPCSECTHTFPVTTQKLYFEFTIHQISLISECGVWYSIYHKNFANVLPKRWNSNIFLHKNLCQRKKDQKRAKRPNTFLRPADLRWGQKKAKRPTKIF